MARGEHSAGPALKFSGSKHRQAAERAAADIEGHSTAAEYGQPRRLSARPMVDKLP
jgi:hypothetical protein